MNRNEQIYLHDDQFNNAKEMFKFVAGMALDASFKGKLCDFGCSAGQFLYYVRDLVPEASLFGMDINERLLESARNHVPSATFYQQSVLDDGEFEFDISFMCGVLSSLDNFETVIGNLIKWTKKGGTIYITELFNPYKATIRSKYTLGNGESGNWNIFSQKEVDDFLFWTSKVTDCKFIEFKMPIDLAKQYDPVRSWTVNTDNGRILTNGLCMIEPFYTLKICL